MLLFLNEVYTSKLRSIFILHLYRAVYNSRNTIKMTDEEAEESIMAVDNDGNGEVIIC